jgi:hypothetical protein
MSDELHTESITFKEAGVIFDVHPVSMSEGNFLVLVTSAHGNEDALIVEGYEIDRWLGENVPADHPDRFKGYRLTLFRHETRTIEEDAYPTRGALLKWFDEGGTPTPDDVVELAQSTGDHLLLLKDNDGNVLLDRRELVKERLAAIYKDTGYFSILADLSDYEIFRDSPAPVR